MFYLVYSFRIKRFTFCQYMLLVPFSGNCLLKNSEYADTVENFVNAKSGVEYYCMCNQGYETLYPDNDPIDIPKDEAGTNWCNVEQVTNGWF